MPADTSADWLGVGEAREHVLRSVAPLPAERRDLLDALGSVLREDLVSPLDLPPWDNSAMDGFAVRAEDVRGASREEARELRVTGDVAAGAAPERAVEPGTAIRVMTGAPVPEGADTVVRVEHTDGGREVGTAAGRVRIHSDQDAGRNIRPRGGDVRRGERVLRSGTSLRAAELGIAASLGRAHLTVVRRPVVGVLASGDELVDVDGFAEVLAGRRIVSSNTYTLAAQLAEAGCAVRLLGTARDTRTSLAEHLERARGCDALITSAGVSMGEHDHVRGALLELGVEVGFWRVRMRPGSPFAFGRVAGLGGIPWFGLPGNPVSSMVTFEVLVRPALLRMAGHAAVHPATERVRFTGDYPSRAGLTHFVRVRLERTEEESLAHLERPQGSHVLTSMAGADALLVVPEEAHGAVAGGSYTAVLLGGGAPRARAGF